MPTTYLELKCSSSCARSAFGFRHMAMVFRIMQLDLAAHFARGILDLALCRRECILDRDHDVLVFGRIACSRLLQDADIKSRPPPRHRGNSSRFIDQLRFRLPAAVRREIWGNQSSFMSRPRRDTIEIPRHIWERMENALAYAA